MDKLGLHGYLGKPKINHVDGQYSPKHRSVDQGYKWR